ncbi:MAG: transketolase C-terminal domain-containing protein, partial [Actinomycetes bacterium]
LSRQNLPVVDRSQCGSAEGTAKGAYVICPPKTSAQVLLIATGSEVHLAIAGAKILEAEGISAQVVSAPCLEWFAEQSPTYRESVLPVAVTARVSIEAGIGMGWREIVGATGEIISVEHFASSASGSHLFKEFGFTPEAVAAAAKRSIAKSK